MLNVRVITGDCRTVMGTMAAAGEQVDAIVTDPPYEINLHGKSWDRTGVAFDPGTWTSVYKILKPGGFLIAFSASRLYHRVACAVEDSGFTIYPFLQWQFPGGLPKPVNVSELFDRDSGIERKHLGPKKGSGFTRANVTHGAQHRSKETFEARERYISDESRAWKGYYYGVNAFRPTSEPIVLAQKPKSEARMIDNLRKHGVGALDFGDCDPWPTPVFAHPKARKTDHDSNHPSVKPVPLMEELIRLVCPAGGTILDPFAGTGSTGVAALRSGRHAILVERDEAMIPVIRRRCCLPEPGADATGP